MKHPKMAFFGRFITTQVQLSPHVVKHYMENKANNHVQMQVQFDQHDFAGFTFE